VREKGKGLKTVKFVGPLSHERLPSFLQGMDFGVVPSVFEEPFGVINLEYMACELRVVAARVGGIPETVIEEKSGFLVKPSNPEELADAIERLINDGSLRKERAKTAWKHVRENFTWDRHVDHLIQIYRTIEVYKSQYEGDGMRKIFSIAHIPKLQQVLE
jgi:glycosyltransferase involved in cell wall biosynthesis